MVRLDVYRCERFRVRDVERAHVSIAYEADSRARAPASCNPEGLAVFAAFFFMADDTMIVEALQVHGIPARLAAIARDDGAVPGVTKSVSVEVDGGSVTIAFSSLRPLTDPVDDDSLLFIPTGDGVVRIKTVEQAHQSDADDFLPGVGSTDPPFFSAAALGGRWAGQSLDWQAATQTFRVDAFASTECLRSTQAGSSTASRERA